MSRINTHDVLDHLHTAVVSLSRQLTIDYLNASAQSLFNMSLTRAHGKPLNSLFSDSDKLHIILDQAASDDAPIIQRQVSLTLHSMQTAVLDVSVTPTPHHLLLEFSSLDRLMRINQEKHSYSTQNSSRELIRTLAHEIKNPLAGISGAAQLLQREAKDTQYSEYTEIVIAETKRLANLVDNLLGPYKQQQLHSVNIHEVLEHVLTLARVELSNSESPDITLTRQYDPSIPGLMADKEQLIQAVLNIVKNAIQALTEHQSSGDITVVSAIERNHTIGLIKHRLVCRVDIIDNGPGISEAHADTLFLPLVSHKEHGTGLGLAVAQSVISQHAGLITFNSAPGHTCFSLYLPLHSP
ncbi:MAG: nitrogen regulation protein NR(II) [Pseudomonadota bacterium]